MVIHGLLGRNRIRNITGAALLLTAGALTLGCSSEPIDNPEADLIAKQLKYAKQYKGWGVIGDAIEDFRKSSGHWPADFRELYDSNILPKSFQYQTTSGMATQTVDRNFADLQAVTRKPERAEYLVNILGHEIGRRSLTWNAPLR